MIPQLVWGARGDGVAVLFYTPGKVSVDTRAGEVAIESNTNYPLEGPSD